jgi:hypothetical protein
MRRLRAGAKGPFTVSMWFRANASDMDGDLFQYVFSASKYASRQNFSAMDTFYPNQARLYLSYPPCRCCFPVRLQSSYPISKSL